MAHGRSHVQFGQERRSAHEIHRTLGVTYKTAWFMMHRLREAMNELNPAPMGGEGQIMQADETYYGNTSKRAKGYRKGHRHKSSVVALVEPQGPGARFPCQDATAETFATSSLPMCLASPNCTRTKANFITRSAPNLPRTRPSNTAGTKAAFMSAKTVRPRTPSKISSAISSGQ